MTSVRQRASDAQLRSAADRIRRLSAGVEDPDDQGADLASFSEEAIRRTYRIVELGLDFWMDLLRLDPTRRLIDGQDDADGSDGESANQERAVVTGATPLNVGWQVGRILGATVRGWGDLKNAQRGLLWFDSSPLLGPKKKDPVTRESLEPTVRILTESTVSQIMEIVEEFLPIDRDPDPGQDDSNSSIDLVELNRSLFMLGLQAGVLEREQRNPQATSRNLFRSRRDTVIAFILEGDQDRASSAEGGEEGSSETPPDFLRVDETKPETKGLDERLEGLKRAQGGFNERWQPLYSFLRQGDVVAISLGSDNGAIGDWGLRWRQGRPIALALVTTPPSWKKDGWRGNVGSVLFLDGPVNHSDDPASILALSERERIRTAFRFPSIAPKTRNGKDPLLELFGLSDSGQSTEDLALARLNHFRESLITKSPGDDTADSRAGERVPEQADKQTESGDLGYHLVAEMVEGLPVGSPGPWRRVQSRDLRATLGEFLEPYAETIGYFEYEELPDEVKKANPDVKGWNAWYPANINIDRFALTSDNLRLGVAFDNPVRPGALPSARRIVPRTLPGDGGRASLERLDQLPGDEARRIKVADLHRLVLDEYKRGLNVASRRDLVGQIVDDRTKREEEQRRATSWMPAVTLDPGIEIPEGSESNQTYPTTDSLWEETLRDGHFKGHAKRLGEVLEKGGVTCAGFPDVEQRVLRRMLESRDALEEGLHSKKGRIPIDPAGTRVRDAILVQKKNSAGCLLITLTDDSVMPVDVGSIVWMLLAYRIEGPANGKVRKVKGLRRPILDIDAHATVLRRAASPVGAAEEDHVQAANQLRKEAWKLLWPCWKNLH